MILQNFSVTIPVTTYEGVHFFWRLRLDRELTKYQAKLIHLKEVRGLTDAQIGDRFDKRREAIKQARYRGRIRCRRARETAIAQMN